MPFSRLCRANSIDHGSPGSRSSSGTLDELRTPGTPYARDTVRAVQGSSFAARFGRILLREGIATLPSALYHFGGKLNLYAQHIWFISYILSHKWDEDLPYPSLSTMSKCSGMSKRQLQRYRDELQGMGYLRVYARSSEERGQETNAYDFADLFEKIEQCITEAKETKETKETIGGRTESPGHIEAHVEETQGRNGEWANTEWERSERDGSFVARYGRVISRYGIAAVPRALFSLGKELALTPQQAWFIAYIFSHQWDTALPYPSIIKMANLTGYTIANLHNIKSSLVSRGFLRLVHRTKANGTQDSNAYDFSPLLDEMARLLQPVHGRPDGQIRSQADQPQIDIEQSNAHAAAPRRSEDENFGPKLRRGAAANLKRRERQAELASTLEEQATQSGEAKSSAITGKISTSDPRDMEYSVPGDMQYTVGGDAGYMDPGDMQYTEGVNPVSQTPVTRSMPSPVTRSGHEIEPLIEQDEKNDSSRITPILLDSDERKYAQIQISIPQTQAVDNPDTRSFPASPSSSTSSRIDRAGVAYSSYIVKVATDFSYELGDGEHVLENASQAQRLWRASGFSEQAFVQAMYEAKSRTRTGQNTHGASGLLNKMAYFFVCLKTLLAPK